MARFRKIKNTFSSGELSPKLHKLAGLEEYQKGLAEQLNQVSIRTGGSFSRPGTRFVKDFNEDYLEDASGEIVQDKPKVLHIPFRSDGDFDLCVAIHLSTGHDNTIAAADLIDTDSGNVIRVDNWGNYWLFGYPDEEKPWDTEESALDFTWVQIGTFIILAHGSGKFQPIVIQVIFQNGPKNYPSDFQLYSWGLNSLRNEKIALDISQSFRFPNKPINRDTSIYLQAAFPITNIEPIPIGQQHYDGAVFAVYDESGSFSTDQKFDDSYIGKSIVIDYVAENRSVLGIIKSLPTDAPAETIEVDVKSIFNNSAALPFPSTIKSNVWWVSDWGGNVDLWPRSIGFYEQRLIFASSVSKPEKIWVSALNDYSFFQTQRSFTTNRSPGNFVPVFTGDALTTDPFDIIPADGGIVTWLNSQDKLYIGSYVGESIGGGIQNQFSNSQAFIKNQDSKGGRRIKTERTNDGVIFVGRDGKQLFQFKYSSNGSHVSRNLSLLADHLVYHNTTKDKYTDITFKQIAWANSMSVLWVLTTENQLLGITIDPDTNTLGWHKHEIGGNAEVISIAATQGKTEDSLLMFVKRTVESTENRTFSGFYFDWAAGVFYTEGEQVYESSHFGFKWRFTAKSDFTSGTSFDINNWTPDSFIKDYYTLEKFTGFKESFNTDVNLELDGIPYTKPPFNNPEVNKTIADYRYYDVKDIRENDLNWFLDGSSFYQLTEPSTQFKLNFCNFDISGYPSFQASTSYNRGDTIVDSTYYGFPWVFICENDFTSGTTFGPNDWEPVVSSRIAKPIAEASNSVVSVIADGIYIGEKYIDMIPINTGFGGLISNKTPVITLDEPATSIVIGYSYTKRIKTLPIEVGSQIGDSIEPVKRLDRVEISLYKSKGGSYGSEENDLKPLEYTGDPNLLETTDFVESFPSSNDTKAQIILEEKGPYPMNVIALSMRGVLHDG